MVFDRIFSYKFLLRAFLFIGTSGSECKWQNLNSISHMVISSLTCEMWELIAVRVSIFKSIVFKMFHKMRVASDLCIYTLCLVWSAADGCKTLWEEWVLNILLWLEQASKAFCCYIILFDSIMLPPHTHTQLFFFCKNNLNYSVT